MPSIVHPVVGGCSLWVYSGVKSASVLDYAAEEGPGLRGKSVRLIFCRASRGGGENFSGNSSTGIKIVSPSGGLSNCQRKSSMAVCSFFTGGLFRAGIVEVQEGTLGGAIGESLKQPTLLEADEIEGRLIT